MTTFLISGLSIIMGACLASLYWLYNKQCALEQVIEHCDKYVEIYKEALEIQEKKTELFQELSDTLAKENNLLKDELSKKYGQNTTN